MVLNLNNAEVRLSCQAAWRSRGGSGGKAHFTRQRCLQHGNLQSQGRQDRRSGKAGTGPHRGRLAERWNSLSKPTRGAKVILSVSGHLLESRRTYTIGIPPNCAPAVYPHLSVSNGDIWTN